MQRVLLGLFLWLNQAACSWASPVGPAAFHQPFFELIAGSESVGNGIVTCVTQDQRGFIWFGTLVGLYRYDGYRLREFRNQPGNVQSLSDDYVRALLPHSSGKLWIATQGGGISIFDPSTEQFTRITTTIDPADQRPSIAAISLAEGTDGDVWVGLGNAGVARWHRKQHKFIPYAEALANAGAGNQITVRAIMTDRLRNLWLGTGNGLYVQRDGSQSFERVPLKPEQTGPIYVYSLREASDRRLWIGTQSHGVYVLNPINGDVRHIPAGQSGQAGAKNQRTTGTLAHPWISGFVEPKPGWMWAYTYGGGIDVIDAQLQVHQNIRADLSIPGGLALDRLTEPFVDRSGLIWAGTWGGGLQRHNPRNAAAFVSVRHSPKLSAGLSSNSVQATLPISDQVTWIGTGGNGIDVLDQTLGVIASYRADPAVPGRLLDGTIRSFARAKAGIWVGTQQSGVQYFDHQTQQFDQPLQGLPVGPIRQLLELDDGRLLIGLQAALAVRDAKTGVISVVNLTTGRAFTDAVWSLTQDALGRAWVGTPGGLLMLAAGAQSLQSIESGDVALRQLSDLRFDAEGQLWIASQGGIVRMQETAGRFAFERILDNERAQRQLGQHVLPDRMGRIWSPRSVFDTNTMRLQPISAIDGIDIGSVELGSASIAADGRMFFGGTRGLLMIDPKHYVPPSFNTKVQLTALDIDGVPRGNGLALSGLHLAPTERRFTAEFAALDYSAAKTVRYAYRLVGLETQWNETDAEHRLASYNNLWPGKYELQVRAKASNAEWGASLLLPVRIAPAWWQTPWAMALAAMSLVVLTALVFRFRNAQVLRRASALQSLIDSRTKELKLSKENAEQALDELKSAQTRLVAAEKMASLGQLVAGVAHELNTPVGIAITAASHLQDIAKESATRLAANTLTREQLETWQQDLEQAARLILSNVQRAGTLVASFKQVSVDQSSGKRRVFKLAEFLGEVQTALYPSVRRTGHTLELQCDNNIRMDSYPGALFQIITNLINNALLHAFASDQHGHILILAEARAEQLELCVHDDGQGMDAATARHVFDPFFTTKRGSGGSGLGLHIVHNLVTQLLKGDIQLHTAPGQGARFVMHLPLIASNVESDASNVALLG